MRTLLLLLLVFPLTSHAENNVFRKDSPVPAELQAKVLAALKERCLSSLYGFEEESTQVSYEPVDQDRETHYRTYLKASYIFDGAHPVGVGIEVRSAEFAISNPNVEHSGVLSVKAFSQGICQ